MMRARLRHLPVPLMVSAVLLVIVAAVGWALDGGAGAAGGAAGVALVAVSYVLSSLALAWADSVSPRLVLTVGLVTYMLKFGLLGAAVFAVAATGWAGLRMTAIGIIVGTVAWVVAQVWWTAKAKIPYVEIEPK
ncbi:hypothetical protein SAMN05444365_10361 [Micromonospora pattaloongensis]|uniref:ATP synthase protein I n=1 Tax=Micromonospora pattaloongensis TaxID=405436 RepID=A0A1H3LRP9_9ACTN|nr:hypothetical protein [Micromonospora pattaloongensis]SDY67006.1 hypothetical protein SAMN05444365_10361 [Micromonospora pattaloongensis]